MPRNRIIYQSQAVAILIQNNANTALHTTQPNWRLLDGIQSLNYGVEVAREDVYQFGKLGAADRICLEPPTVTAEVSMYYPTNTIGTKDFNQMLSNSIKGQSPGTGDGSAASPIYGSALAMVVDIDGKDFQAHDDVAITKIHGVNMSSWGYEVSVGAIPTLTLGFEGTSMSYDTASTGVFVVDQKVDNYGTGLADLPKFLRNKIVPFTGVVIQMDGTELLTGLNLGVFTHFTNAQSANISFDLGFEGLQRIGTADGQQFARVATLPASATLDLEAIAIDRGLGVLFGSLFSQKASSNANLNAGGRANVSILIGTPNTAGAQTFKLQKATLDSSNYTAGMGDNATCSASFGVSISSGDSATNVDDSALVFSTYGVDSSTV